ncbi:MAG: type II secretion system F family protein [Synergistales bacterium]|nr:type II secretion system F family protein [Synergistales bacterium]
MHFAYKARRGNGDVVRGKQEARTRQEVADWLRANSLLPITIETTSKGAATGSSAEKLSFTERLQSLGRKLQEISTISIKDKAIFFRQLSTMLASGLTLTSSLDILQGQTKNKRLIRAIREVKRQLDTGNSMAGAMRGRSEFTTLIVAMVQAGEESGMLDVTLERLASFLEKQDALRRKILSAVSYPAVVTLFAIGALYVVVAVIVPRFQVLFRQMNINLPGITRFLFSMAELLQRYWYVALLIFVGVIGLLILLSRLPRTKPYMDRFKLMLPIFGDILRKSALTRASRTLSTLLRSGVPILSALEMTAGVANNERIGHAYIQLQRSAKAGGSLGETASEMKEFPPMIAHMITVGEQTGQLEEMLDRSADWFEGELDEKINNLTSILEPFLLLLVGGVVGIVALSIFTPILSAIQQYVN